MQVVPFKGWTERTLFYTSKMHVERIETGNKYNVLRKCVNISILDFIYLDEKEFFNSFHIRNDKTYKIYTDKMEFYLIELPKIPKEIENISDLLLWVKFINSSSKEEIKMLATKSKNRTNEKIIAKKALCVIFYSLSKASFRMLAKIFDTHPSFVYRWVVEASEKLPEQQIDDSITGIEFDEMWHFIKSKKTIGRLQVNLPS